MPSEPDPHAGDAVDPDVDLHVADQQRELRPPGRWAVLVAIATGGVLGAEARYGLGIAWPHSPAGWPWSTLVVNASGCLLIGVLMVVITEWVSPHPLVRPLLGVGVLGGYTTFSTYGVDVVGLALAGRAGPALGYLVVTPVAALVAVWVGASLTRAVRLVCGDGGPGHSGGVAA